MKLQIPQSAGYILDMLHKNGKDAYLAGGCVRDSWMGKMPHDWDICTSALPQEVISIFEELGNTVIPTGLKHGTVTVLHHGEPFEITTFRIDGSYSDGRRPDEVTFTSCLEEDLSRRDFTINAMAYSAQTGLQDPFGGVQDIQNRLIRCVGDPFARFQEDALRILRAIRFSSVTGFLMEQKTLEAARQCLPLLSNVSQERKREELCKLLQGDSVCEVLLAYREIVAVVIPELEPCFGFRQNNPHHIWDVWEHTVYALNYAPNILNVRLAVLFHDIGKPRCYTIDENQIGHFYNHSTVSVQIAESVMKRLKFDHDTIRQVTQLIEFHDRPNSVTPKSVKRLLNQIGPEQFELLLQVRIADSYAQNPDQLPQKLEKINRTRTIKEQILARSECFSLKALAVNGRDLISLGIEPGPQIGRTLKMLLEQVLDNPELNQKEILLNIAKTR